MSSIVCRLGCCCSAADGVAADAAGVTLSVSWSADRPDVLVTACLVVVVVVVDDVVAVDFPVLAAEFTSVEDEAAFLDVDVVFVVALRSASCSCTQQSRHLYRADSHLCSTTMHFHSLSVCLSPLQLSLPPSISISLSLPLITHQPAVL